MNRRTFRELMENQTLAFKAFSRAEAELDRIIMLNNDLIKALKKTRHARVLLIRSMLESNRFALEVMEEERSTNSNSTNKDRK